MVMRSVITPGNTYISCLEIEGAIINNEEEIMSHLFSHYTGGFQSTQRTKTLNEIPDLIGGTFPMLWMEEQKELEGEITFQESSEAVGKLHNDKSPGDRDQMVFQLFFFQGVLE